jgi:hypothetical protein
VVVVLAVLLLGRHLGGEGGGGGEREIRPLDEHVCRRHCKTK